MQPQSPPRPPPRPPPAEGVEPPAVAHAAARPVGCRFPGIVGVSTRVVPAAAHPAAHRVARRVGHRVVHRVGHHRLAHCVAHRRVEFRAVRRVVLPEEGQGVGREGEGEVEDQEGEDQEEGEEDEGEEQRQLDEAVAEPVWKAQSHGRAAGVVGVGVGVAAGVVAWMKRTTGLLSKATR